MREREPRSFDGQPPFQGPWQAQYPVRNTAPTKLGRRIALWAAVGLLWLSAVWWLGVKILASWRSA